MLLEVLLICELLHVLPLLAKHSHVLHLLRFYLVDLILLGEGRHHHRTLSPHWLGLLLSEGRTNRLFYRIRLFMAGGLLQLTLLDQLGLIFVKLSVVLRDLRFDLAMAESLDLLAYIH